MENYKEKYEKALSRASYIKDYNTIATPQEVAELLFPELKESEDESIRKFLYDFINNIPPEEWNKDKPNEDFRITILDWLEKQGKNEEINEVSYRTGIKRVLDNPESYGLKKQVEQKSSWSEEDMKKINKTIWLIEHYASHGHVKELREEAVNWLKSLKERYSWKPSDEQIKGIKCAIKTLQHQLNVGDKRLNSLYDDLKKLREE